MSFISASYSVKKLSDKRYTSENTLLTTEAFVSPFDINADEVYTDFRYIPTSSAGLPYSGSDQDLGIVSASITDPSISEDVAVLKYWYRKKVKRGNQGGRSTWFFVEDDGFGANDPVFSDQLITSSQQTNFISPKYIIADNANNTTEAPSPGYKVQVSVGTDAASATVVNNLTYVFDYKTGVLSFLPGQTPAAVSSTSNYVFISAYQYVGRTLSGQIADGSIGGGFTAEDISGSFASTSASIAVDIAALETTNFTEADISGSTRIYISGSDDGFELSNDSTLKFISGTAGVTVVSNGSDTITIGSSSDSVTFQDIILSGSSNNAVVLESRQNLVMRASEDGNSETRIETSQLVIQNEAISGIPKLIFLNTDSSVGSDQETARIELGENDDFNGVTRTAGATISTVARETHDETTGGTKIVFSAIAATSSSLRHILELDSGEGYEGNFTAAGNIRALSGSNFVGNLVGTATSASSLTITNLDAGAGTDEGSAGYGILFTDNTGSGVSVYSDQNSGLRWLPNSSTLAINALNISDNGTTISISGNRATVDLFNNNPGGADVINIGNATEEINIGVGRGVVNILGSASIAGDLTVQGDLVSINTTELNVEDQFILLNSGSVEQDGGIIVQTDTSANGTALFYDHSSNRWALAQSSSVAWNSTSATAQQYVVSVSSSAATPTGNPANFGLDNASWYGMMYVDTSDTTDGGLYIYLP